LIILQINLIIEQLYLQKMHPDLMTRTNPLLFIYGTLQNKNNEFGAYLSTNCDYLKSGMFKGSLYDAGEYPGALYQAESEGFVYGRIFYMNNPEKTLSILDEYEGVGENEVRPNLFTRQLIEIETDDELMSCWVYLYNLPVEGLRQILSGSYPEA
jgi:gamma-glutamylcyclotransferase (GGCT)/AIG2-like uncharacterized protein YtfP